MRWWRVAGTVVIGVALLASGLAVSAWAVAARRGSTDPAPLTDAGIEAIAVEAGRATLGVQADTCTGRMVGSGFLAGGRVVTSRHLVSGASEMAVDGAGWSRRLAVDGSLDPADLAFSAPLADQLVAGPSLEVAAVPPPDGTSVVIVARAGGRLRWLAAVARTVDGTSYGASGPLLLLDRPVAPGWSGGPVLDRSGRVVAVVRAVDSSTGVSLAEPVDRRTVPGAAWGEDDIQRAAPIGCKSDHPKG